MLNAICVQALNSTNFPTAPILVLPSCLRSSEVSETCWLLFSYILSLLSASWSTWATKWFSGWLRFWQVCKYCWWRSGGTDMTCLKTKQTVTASPWQPNNVAMDPVLLCKEVCNSKNGSCYEKNCSYQNNWMMDIQMEKRRKKSGPDVASQRIWTTRSSVHKDRSVSLL